MSSKKTIGAGIALDGEKEYKAQIKEINNVMGVLKSELKLTASAFDNNGKSMNDMRAKSEVLEKQVTSQKDKVETLKKALENAKNEYGENSKQVRSWQVQLNNAEADLNKMNKELDELKSQTSGINKIKNGFSELKEKIEDVEKKTTGLKTALSAVGNGAKKIGGLTVAGISASVTALAGLTTAAIGAGKSIYSLAKITADYGGEIDDGAQKLNVSISDYQKLSYAATLGGTSIDTLAVAQKKLSSSGSKLNIMDAIEQVASISNESERAAKGIELFGSKAYQELVPMLNMGADGLKNIYAEAEKYGMIMSDEAVAASAAFGDSLDKLSMTSQGLKNRLTGELLPGITKITDGLSSVFIGDTEIGIQQIETGITDVTNKITELLPTVLSVGGSILETLVTSITDNLPTLISVGTPILLEIGSGIISNLPLLLDSAVEILGFLISEISNNKEQLLSATTTIITKLSTGLLDNLPAILDIGLDLVIGLVDGLTTQESLEAIAGAAFDCVGKIISTILSKIPDILSLGGQIIEGLWNGIKDKDGWLRQKISGFFGGVKQSIKDFFGIASPSKWARYEIMGNVMDSFGLAIDENADNVRKKMTAFTSSLQSDVKMQYSIETLTDRITAAQPSQKIIAATYSQYEPHSSIHTTSDDKFERILALLEIIAMNSKKDIMLNKDILVGELTPEINEKLGDVYALKERGD